MAIIDIYEYIEKETNNAKSAIFIKVINQNKMPIINTKMFIKNCDADSINENSLSIDHRKWNRISNNCGTLDSMINKARIIEMMG